ncbi:MAG: N-acetyltransferase family protein [Christensenellales bacterium]
MRVFHPRGRASRGRDHGALRFRRAFSYGIAVSGAMRRRGVASSALPLLFAAMKARGFAVCAVQIAPDNAASLALHRRLGFAETGRSAAAVTMEKML